MKQYLVTPKPFIKSWFNADRLFEQRAIITLMVLIVGIIFSGINGVLVAVISVVSALFFELLYNVICYDKIKLENYSFVITALTYSCLCGAKTPLYVPVIAMFFAVVFIKLMFGGFANNMFNLAGAGALFVGIIFGEASNLWLENGAVGFASNSFEYLANQNFSINYIDYITGNVNASIASLCFIPIIVGAIYLIVAKIIDYKIPVVAIISFCLMALILNGFNFACLGPYLLCGNFLFVTVFLLTDYVTSPNTKLGQVLYAVIFGVLCSLVIRFNLGGELAIIASLIIANCFSPLFDRIIRPRYFGEGK